MPVVAPGIAPEDAFAELDADGDGIIKGEEFAAIPKSDKFNKVTREEMVRCCMSRFGAARETFAARVRLWPAKQKCFSAHFRVWYAWD